MAPMREAAEPDGHPSAGSTHSDLAKPPELLAAGPACADLFEQLRSWFDVPTTVDLDMCAVDGDEAVRQLGDPQMVAALAMRKLQALHLLTVPGVRTTTDVIVTLIDSMMRALFEAPRTQLKRRAATVDWDHEWTVLDAGMLWRSHRPEDELAQFDRLVSRILIAREAVLAASGDAIEIFV
jgi:hypothetical protein